MASAGERLSSSDYKKKKDMDEARKAGTLPPEQDEEGNMINPHNPDYITKRPWYLGDSGPSLKHQSIQKEKVFLSLAEADALHRKGIVAKAATKYRKGACKNCGAMSHKTEECVERPRSKGAWKTNKDIAPDEVIQDVRSSRAQNLTFDAKRDAWLGVNADDHMKLVYARHEKVDQERRKKKLEHLQKKLLASESGEKKGKKSKATNSDEGTDSPARSAESDSDSDYESDDDGMSEDEEYKDKEGGKVISTTAQRQGGLGGAQMKVTVRNLRIREDTAKYLRNLDPNSAYYDPKTRSMRDNPTPNINPDDLPFAGDNFIRISGDAKKHAQTQLFAWDAYENGQGVHPQATPSQTELMQKQFEERKKKLKDEQRNKLMEKYGGEEHLDAPPAELLFAQTEQYVEYSRDGRLIKGQEKGVVRSKYEEDVHINNHTSVWGSWFDRKTMSWGFSCCHSRVKNSYCTGEAGKQANEVAEVEAFERSMLPPRPAGSGASEQPKRASRADIYGENLAPDIDTKTLTEALKKEEEYQKQHHETDERKRKYNSVHSVDVSTEEMEAYRLKKSRSDDPMAKYLGKDDLLDD